MNLPLFTFIIKHPLIIEYNLQNYDRWRNFADMDFQQEIIRHLPYQPNAQQAQVIAALGRFCSPEAPDDAVFVLNGYAGTGKTSICGALVKALPAAGLSSVLLAPTGRAAKVFSAYAGRTAYTIHRRIYRHPGVGDTSSTVRAVIENKHTNTVFIVDEASMISSDASDGSSLLEDLIHYVYTGTRCRLLLLGDTAQLPPVGCDFSPAMSVDILHGFGLRVSRATLTETARQATDSGILHNATLIRRNMRQTPLPEPRIVTRGFSDVHIISGEDMPEELYSAYSRDGLRDTIVITRSNFRATAFNREIRASVLYLEQELTAGELLLVAKNNYFWSQKIKGIDFIANGDVLEIESVLGTEVKYGFRFADVIAVLPDSDIRFEAKVMLDSLATETATVGNNRIAELYYAIMEDPTLFDPSTPAAARLKALKSNPYWNALQVKYAYCVTCHKAQGGQWKNVFVDMGYIPPEAMGMDFYRWLYTAVTRARSNLYFLGLNQE